MDFTEEHTPILKGNLSVGHLSACNVSRHTHLPIYFVKIQDKRTVMVLYRSPESTCKAPLFKILSVFKIICRHFKCHATVSVTEHFICV